MGNTNEVGQRICRSASNMVNKFLQETCYGRIAKRFEVEYLFVQISRLDVLDGHFLLLPLPLKPDKAQGEGGGGGEGIPLA